jgi:hypothetical protein
VRRLSLPFGDDGIAATNRLKQHHHTAVVLIGAFPTRSGRSHLQNHKSSSLTLLTAAALLLSGCGASESVSDNDPNAPPPSDPAPAVVEGVATPSSVAVVTATNAQ